MNQFTVIGFCSSHNFNRHWNLINLWFWIDWAEPSRAVPCWAFWLAVFVLYLFDDIPFELYLKRDTITIAVNTVNTIHHLHHHQHHRHQFVIFLWNIVLVLWQNKQRKKKWIFFFFSSFLFDSIRIWSDFICLLMFRIKYVACERDEMCARQYCTWKSNDMSECVCVCVYMCQRISKVVYLYIYCNVLHVTLPISKHKSHANIISNFFSIQKERERNKERRRKRKRQRERVKIQFDKSQRNTQVSLLSEILMRPAVNIASYTSIIHIQK